MRWMKAWATGLIALAGPAACGPGAEHEPIGEQLWRTVGGWCDGGCDSVELRRDDDALQLLWDGDATYGRWTDAALVEYAAASAEAAEEPVGAPPRSCSPADGIDQQITLVHDGRTWTATFCLTSEPPPYLARADALFERVVNALRECEDDEFVDSDC